MVNEVLRHKRIFSGKKGGEKMIRQKIATAIATASLLLYALATPALATMPMITPAGMCK